MADFDSMNEMLIACVKACGGSKVVAPMLFPEKVKIDPKTHGLLYEPAQRFLLNCLDENRAEKLSPDHAYKILEIARQNNISIGINYVCDALGYTHPAPIQKEDENEKLMREFIAASKAMSAITDRLANVGLRAKS